MDDAAQFERDVMSTLMGAGRSVLKSALAALGPQGRCIVTERVRLLNGQWTEPAAKVGALAVAEMPTAQAEALFREVGTMTASRTSLLRLVGELSDVWEADLEGFDAAVRADRPIPARAATAVVSLDGVMVMMVDSAKAKIKRLIGTEMRGVGRACPPPPGGVTTF